MNDIITSPVFGVLISIIAYEIGALIKQKLKLSIFNPLLIAMIILIIFLFIPAGVGLMISFDMLKGKVIAFSTIIIISTLIVWVVTAYVVKFLRKVCSK